MNPQVHVRFPDDLLAWLRDDAQAHGRTVAQSIRFYLEQAKKLDAEMGAYAQHVASTFPRVEGDE
jgi:hypothetical protein